MASSTIESNLQKTPMLSCLECQEQIILEIGKNPFKETVQLFQKEISEILEYEFAENELLCLNCITQKKNDIEEENRYIEDLCRTEE